MIFSEFLRCLRAGAAGLVWVAAWGAWAADPAVTTGSVAVTSSPVSMVMAIDPSPGAPRNSEGDVIALPGGNLALVYTKFSGGAADHSSAHLAIRRSADGGNTWSADMTLLENEGSRNVMSVSLRDAQDGGILLFYLRKDTDSTSCAMYVRRSYDGLATLSDAVQVTTLPGYHVVNNDRVLRLASGRLLVPAALHTDLETTRTGAARFFEKGHIMAYLSDDDGRTWRKDEMPVTPLADRKLLLQEPGAVELADGRIMMYIRSGHGFQYAAFSPDQGKHWTAPQATTLASPLSPATIERVPGSALLMAVWNDHSGRWPFKKKDRTPLCMAVSRDEGATWSPSRMLEPDPAGWFCYTSLTFVEDQILMTYCAGQGRRDGLNRLKMSRLPVEWVKGLE